MSDDIVQTLADALRAVIDPELGYNIVDIGLVYDIEVEEDHARILLTTTTRGLTDDWPKPAFLPSPCTSMR